MPSLTQHIRDCASFDGPGLEVVHPGGAGREDCTVIVGVVERGVDTDGNVTECSMWESHELSTIDPIARLNPDCPHVDDRAGGS